MSEQEQNQLSAQERNQKPKADSENLTFVSPPEDNPFEGEVVLNQAT